jgi:hypothetical protein
MDRVLAAFAEGLVVAAVLVLVVTVGALALLAWAVARLRRPNRALGGFLLAASLAPLVTVMNWLAKGSLAWRRPAEWGVPILFIGIFAGLGIAHLVAARRREAAVFAEMEDDT